MSRKSLNLLLRFLLELIALVVTGIWGYHLSDSWTRFMWAILFPVLFATLWGVYAVREDPARSGKTVIPTPGIVRLLLELGLFGVATWMMMDLGYKVNGAIFGGVVLIHYLLSLDRVRWLMKTGSRKEEPDKGDL